MWSDVWILDINPRYYFHICDPDTTLESAVHWRSPSSVCGIRTRYSSWKPWCVLRDLHLRVGLLHSLTTGAEFNFIEESFTLCQNRTGIQVSPTLCLLRVLYHSWKNLNYYPLEFINFNCLILIWCICGHSLSLDICWQRWRIYFRWCGQFVHHRSWISSSPNHISEIVILWVIFPF